MPDSSKDRTADDILRDLNQFIQGEPRDVDSLSDEEVSQALAKEGINTEEGFKAVSEMLADALAESELVQASQLRKAKLAAQNQRPQLTIPSIKQIKEFLGLQPQTVAAGYFNKLESCEEEDLESFMEDLYDLGIREFLEEDNASSS